MRFSTLAAFCLPWQLPIDPKGQFPVPFAPNVTHHYALWPWEAIYQPSRQRVAVTLSSIDACTFNATLWTAFTQYLPPSLHSAVAHGDHKNILIDASMWVHSPIDKSRFQLGDLTQLQCLFYDQNQQLLFTAASTPTLYEHSLSAISNYQIHCPLDVDQLNNNNVTFLQIQHQTKHSLYSPVVPFCGNHHHYPAVPAKTTVIPAKTIPAASKTTVSITQEKKHNLTICTATQRSHRPHWWEWLHYYQRLGVDHIYLYDTNLPVFNTSTTTNNHPTSSHEYDQAINFVRGSNGEYYDRKLYLDLLPFIQEGYVSLIPWHYDNCVQHMASGRSADYNRDCNDARYVHDTLGRCGYRLEFQPPRAIAHSNALASCYSRFRFTTKYMLHVDEDEFVALASTRQRSEQSKVKQKKKTMKRNFANLVDFADEQFSAHPHKAAIGFQPVYMYACNQSQINGSQRLRLRDYSYGVLGPLYERKLLVRTDVVGMVFVHYLTMLDGVDLVEKGARDSDVLLGYVHMVESHLAALYHYRDRSIYSVFGLTFPKIFDEYNFAQHVYTCGDETVTNYNQLSSLAELQQQVRQYQHRNVSVSEWTAMRSGPLIFDRGRLKLVVAMDAMVKKRFVLFVERKQRLYKAQQHRGD